MSALLLVIVAGLLGCGILCAMGANDVANAIGTSIGCKAISPRVAVILAAIFEFAGAALVGGSVSTAISHTLAPGFVEQENQLRSIAYSCLVIRTLNK